MTESFPGGPSTAQGVGVGSQTAGSGVDGAVGDRGGYGTHESTYGKSDTQIVRELLQEAGILSPNMPFMPWINLKGFVRRRLYGKLTKLSCGHTTRAVR